MGKDRKVLNKTMMKRLGQGITVSVTEKGVDGAEVGKRSLGKKVGRSEVALLRCRTPLTGWTHSQRPGVNQQEFFCKRPGHGELI